MPAKEIINFYIIIVQVILSPKSEVLCKLPPLGIVAGRGALPLEIAKFYESQNGNCYIAAIDNEIDKKSYANLQYKEFTLGNVGKVIDYFKRFEVKNIVFSGGVHRPNLQNIKVDAVGAKLLSKILTNKFLGDDTILRVVADFFEDYGFTVISVQDIYTINAACVNMQNNILTDRRPSAQEILDIELGTKVITVLGNLDIGQSVIIEDGYVLGIEAAEGTNNLITRCAALRKKETGGVLIKMPKLNQDPRLDLPTVGVETIRLLANHQYNGLAIHYNKVIIIDPQTTIKASNNRGIFLITTDFAQ